MKQLARKILVVGTLMMMAACGGGGGGTTATTTTTTGTVTGKVVDNTTGSAVQGVTVTCDSQSATTAVDGTYTISSVPTGTNKPVNFTKSTYASGSKITNVTASATSRADAALLPVTSSQTVTNTSGAWTSTAITGSSAQVALNQANALVTASGGTPSGAITANLTPIDPTGNPQIMPGNFTTSAGTSIESFGAMEVSFTDATGAPLALGSGKTATIRIPVAAGATSPSATIPAWYYNTTTGQWVQDGTLTLAGTSPNQYYTGTVTHFTTWNADKVLDTTCLTGKVVDSAGVAVSGARVEAEGQGYIGTSAAYTNSSGNFEIKVKALASVILTASTSTAQSQSIVVTTTGASTTCSPISTDLTLGSSTSTVGSAKIKLTWGLNPTDLDSHLTGPQSGTTQRFHVYYSSKGSLTLAPFAALDVDDVTSFGPEIITITQFTAGTYKYSVHHFSGSGTISTSPARVELTLNGSTRIFTPPTTIGGVNTVWEVFQLVVASDGTVTVNTLNTYTSASASNVSKQVASFDEYYLFNNLPKK